MRLPCTKLKFTETGNTLQAHQSLCNASHHKEPLFAGLSELEESTLTFPATVSNGECDNIGICNIKYNNRLPSIARLNSRSFPNLMSSK